MNILEKVKKFDKKLQEFKKFELPYELEKQVEELSRKTDCIIAIAKVEASRNNVLDVAKDLDYLLGDLQVALLNHYDRERFSALFSLVQDTRRNTLRIVYDLKPKPIVEEEKKESKEDIKSIV